MNILWTTFVLGFAIFVRCQQEENATDVDIVTDVDNLVGTTNSSISETSTDEAVDNSTKGDIIYTWDQTETDSPSNITAYTEEIIGNITTTDDIETNWTICSLKPCRNDGTCLSLFNPFLFSCVCQDGYIGLRCGVRDECFANDDGAVCSKGSCVYSKDGASRACKCFFGMSWDEERKECRDNEPPCHPNPCHNGGTCRSELNGGFTCSCLSGYENETCSVKNTCDSGDRCKNGECVLNHEGDLKFCDCNVGYYWNEEDGKCKVVDPPCIPNPCNKNGTCEPTSSGDYNCTCNGHYLDSNCSLLDHCYSSVDDELECNGKGRCERSGNSSRCVCSEGSFLDEDVNTCIEIRKPCLPNPCQNDGLCTPLDTDKYNCSCSEGYTGERCEQHDLCVLQDGKAFCGEAGCRNLLSQATYYCECPDGQYFDFRTRRCSAIDFCPLMTCGENEDCVNSTCVCQENYEFRNKTGRCEADFCSNNPCPVDTMECIEGQGNQDYYCSCKTGYSFNGTHCTDAICLFPSFNNCEQICEVTEDHFECKCHENLFELKEDNKTCAFLGNETCSNKTCNMGTCIKTNEEEICICPRGFFEEDGQCLDMCTAEKLPDGICPNDRCEKTPNGFRCKCEGKYVLSKDKVTCTKRKVCGKTEIGGKTCSANNATCVEDWSEESGYRCECPTGKIKTDQSVCKDICSFEENQRECASLGARCETDVSGEKLCKCPPLYQKPENDFACTKPVDLSYLLTIPLDLNTYTIHQRIMKRSLVTDSSIDESRIKNDIEMAMETLFPELSQVNLLNCKENSNFLTCKVELQFGSITEEDFKRLNSPTLCQRKDSSSDVCLIPPSLISREQQIKSNLKIQKSNPCEEDLKLSLCGSGTTCTSSDSVLFNCTCDTGFVMRDKRFLYQDYSSFVEICDDINECLDVNVCPQHTTCENTIGSYECSCHPGYRIRNKSSDPKIEGCIEVCNPNPCDHGSCEVLGNHDFECRCEAGFAGALCDLRDANFKHAQTNTIIVGAVLGGALLITIILFITTVSRLKRKRSHVDPDQMLYAAEMTERRGGAINNAYQRE